MCLGYCVGIIFIDCSKRLFCVLRVCTRTAYSLRQRNAAEPMTLERDAIHHVMMYAIAYVKAYAVACLGVCQGMLWRLSCHALAHPMACHGICHRSWHTMTIAVACVLGVRLASRAGMGGQQQQNEQTLHDSCIVISPRLFM